MLPLVEFCSSVESPELCACPGLCSTPMDAIHDGLKTPLHRMGVFKSGSVFLMCWVYIKANAKK
jgi:hypothetical protein